MKNIQRDTKYIIKRILIGVGIAIVLFNAKKCDVYASTYDYYLDINDYGWVRQYTTLPSNDISTSYEIEYNNKVYNIAFRRGSSYLNIIPQYMVVSYNNNAYLYMWGLSSDYSPPNDTTKIVLSTDGNGRPQFPPNYRLYDSSTNTGCYPWSSQCSSYFYNIGSSGYGLYQYVFKLDTNINSGDILQSFNYTDSTIIDLWTNHRSDLNIITNSILSISYGYTEDIYSPTNDPLSNYTEIDITGKEAILIVPKNYLQLANTDYYYNEDTSEHFIDLKYGYERCIRSTLIDITDISEFYSVDSWIQGFANNPYDTAELCADEPTLTYSRYLYNSPEMEAMGHPYGYMALLLYNNSIDYSSSEPNWIDNQHNPYGANSVWVNTNLYNYFLIDNLSTFNQTINYKDSSGDDQSTYIESLPTFEEQIESSLNQWDDNTSSLNTSRIESLITFLKIPFTFIRSFNSDSCQPIILPLPRIGNISLPCVKQLISEKFGATLLSILQIIINGAIIYRITIKNIECVRSMLDPVDDKLEVLEL